MKTSVDQKQLTHTLRTYSSEEGEYYDVVAVLSLLRANLQNLMEHKDELDLKFIRAYLSANQKHYLKQMAIDLSKTHGT